MANNNLNPISRLLDIDFPDIKRANWNNSYDAVTTASPGFVQVVHTDHIMAGTRAKLDFNSASFANSTIAPLYGRYKVKYLAVWAPDRLYMADWLTLPLVVPPPILAKTHSPIKISHLTTILIAMLPYLPIMFLQQVCVVISAYSLLCTALRHLVVAQTTQYLTKTHSLS